MDVRSTNGLAIRCHTLVGIPCFINDQASHFVGEIFQISKAIKFHLGAPPVSSMNFDVVPTAIDRMGSENEACLAKGWEVVFVKVATDLVFCMALGIDRKVRNQILYHVLRVVSYSTATRRQTYMLQKLNTPHCIKGPAWPPRSSRKVVLYHLGVGIGQHGSFASIMRPFHTENL
jgi:hypothetical protein